jgi:hypothetical protein
MPDATHCQSCTRPIDGESDFGTEADGTRSRDYCSCCYEHGQFTEPQVRMQQMLDRVIDICAQYHILPREQAERELPAQFAAMKRWRVVRLPARLRDDGSRC